MSFKDSIVTCFSKIVTFDGGARRREYWWFALFVAIIDGVISVILGNGMLAGAISLVIGLCSLSVSIRRLHDIGKSGWFLLLDLIPVVGWIILLIWYCKDSDPGDNRFGPNPKTETVEFSQ